MALVVPTTAEITAQNVANFEAALGQTVPLNDKAFIRVLSAIEAALFTSHYKFGTDRIRQVLALTATGDGLDRIGNNYGVERKAAISHVAEITQPAANGTSIPVGLDYVSDSSGLRYTVNATVVAAGGFATVEITAEDAGADANLSSGDTLTIGREIAGITSTTATYSATVTEGIDRESDDDYRRRVLLEIRTVGGGGNAVDYRTWAEEVSPVLRAFPFSGAPVASTRKLKDGDMELAGTAYWTAANAATLTKEARIIFGVQSLGIDFNGASYPYAYQDSLEIGRTYRIQGFGGRFTGGTTRPIVRNGPAVSDILWTGISTLGFLPFDVTFVASTTEIGFGSDATSGSPVMEFDAITLDVGSLAGGVSLPGDRTVYIEVTEAADPDGIPTQAELDDVFDALTTDPLTGADRMVLGTTEEKLFVEPIVRTAFEVTVNGLVVDPSQEAACKASIETAMAQELRSVAPFVTGVDLALDRNDVITTVSLSEVLSDILKAFGATAGGLSFRKAELGAPVLTTYTLAENEVAKLDTPVLYV